MIRLPIPRLSSLAAATVALALAFSPSASSARPLTSKEKKEAAAKAEAHADKAKAAKADDRRKPAAGAKEKAEDKAVDEKGKAGAKAGKAEAGKPALVATAGDWGAYTAGSGKAKTCYALAKPAERQPASLKREPGYLFISNRPAESVKNEVSFVMGFEVKPNSSPKAEVGSENFDLVAKGSNLWIKNPEEEPQLVAALRKGQKLVVKAQSKRGAASTDTFVLSGVAQMLDRAAKDCQ